jgi:hypothetical protein
MLEEDDVKEFEMLQKSNHISQRTYHTQTGADSSFQGMFVENGHQTGMPSKEVNNQKQKLPIFQEKMKFL